MDIHALVNSIGVGITLLGFLWLAAVKITRLEVKVDTMWGFLLKRAVVEGLDRGLLTLNSPVRLTPPSDRALSSMRDELQKCYRDKWTKLSEAQIALEIEKGFGDQLIHEVCIPNDISFGVCLLIATAIAKGEQTLTEILTEYKIPDYHQREDKRAAADETRRINQ